MKKWVLIGGMLLVVTAAVLAERAGAQSNGDTPSIKQVMVKLHKGANSPLAQLKSELKAENPDWTKVEKHTEEFVILGASLERNVPKKGDQESWKKLAGTYLQDAKALDSAAEAHDKAAAEAALKRINASCKACHQAHKGQ